MNAGHESMNPALPLRSLLACSLAAVLGASACTGAIGGPGDPPIAAGQAGNGSPSGAGGTGYVPPSGAAGTSMMNPPVTGAAGGGVVGPLDVGRVAIHRLNNLEYDNTVRDLVGVDIKLAQTTFQPDEKGEFDNNADAFTINDARYEQYFNAADSIGEMVFANATLKGKLIGPNSLAGCAPSADTTCTSTFVTKFGLKAWRRPLATADVTRLVKVATDAVALGETPENSIKQVVKTLLASPQFLYRIEYDANPASLTSHSLDPYELATRLSYLGWSTMPDDVLFGLAQSGQIGNDMTLVAQVDRMLADQAKGNQFTESFSGQWLGARDMKGHQVEPTAFRMFDEPLRDAMIQEQFMYFNEFLKGPLPMTAFFTTDMNFVNQRLATHYGIPGITGTTMQKVNHTADTRVGFMSLGSFLTFTSFSYRTAPTLRGKWVLENLLCQHIPMPPANVPQLDMGAANDPALQSQNVRTRLAAHSVRADCAACHKTLDPIGLGLENFDAIGAYRTKYVNNETIDSAGVLPTSEMFSTVGQLAMILSAGDYKTKLTDCASEKMMTYALSRALGPSDQPYLNQVRMKWSTEGWGLKALLKDIVLNDTFRFRRGEP
jgi:hypothetical protein